MKPLVSVVIPTYNRARDLERALEAVLAQTYSRWEALVVDNHSTDNTDAVVEACKDARVKLLKVHNHGIIAASRNLGIQHSTGEFVAFLDSDDWWMPRKLEQSVQYLTQGADVVYHDLFWVTKPQQRLFWQKVRTRSLRRPIFRDLLLNGNALVNSSVLVRRELVERLGGISEDRALIAIEDFDLWLRAARVTDKFVRVPQTLGFYWAGDGNYWVAAADGRPLERIISSLNDFEKIYADDLLNVKDSLHWLNYAKGKAYFRMASDALARRHFELIRGGQAPRGLRVRSQVFLLLIHLRHSRRAPINECQ